MIEILRNATFRRVFLAQVVALAGTGLATVALALLALDLLRAGVALAGLGHWLRHQRPGRSPPLRRAAEIGAAKPGHRRAGK